jgi:hypothetical protein
VVAGRPRAPVAVVSGGLRQLSSRCLRRTGPVWDT